VRLPDLARIAAIAMGFQRPSRMNLGPTRLVSRPDHGAAEAHSQARLPGSPVEGEQPRRLMT